LLIEKKVSLFEKLLSPNKLKLLNIRKEIMEEKIGHNFFSKKSKNYDYRAIYGLTFFEHSPKKIFESFAKGCVSRYEEAHRRDLYKHTPTQDTKDLLNLLISNEKHSWIIFAIEVYIQDTKNASSKLHDILINEINIVFDRATPTNEVKHATTQSVIDPQKVRNKFKKNIEYFDDLVFEFNHLLSIHNKGSKYLYSQQQINVSSTSLYDSLKKLKTVLRKIEIDSHPTIRKINQADELCSEIILGIPKMENDFIRELHLIRLRKMSLKYKAEERQIMSALILVLHEIKQLLEYDTSQNLEENFKLSLNR